MKKAIFGGGGFGREVFHHIRSSLSEEPTFFCDDIYAARDVLPISLFDPEKYEMIVAVGDPQKRSMIVHSLPKNTQYFSFIDPSALILDPNINIGRGTIICAGCIITTGVTIGEHCHLNLQTTVGHGTRLDDFVTTAPGVKISGDCWLGHSVYAGTNAAIKEKIDICNNVVIGLNAGVVKDILEPGTYVGTPAKRIK